MALSYLILVPASRRGLGCPGTAQLLPLGAGNSTMLKSLDFATLAGWRGFSSYVAHVALSEALPFSTSSSIHPSLFTLCAC